MKLLSSFIFASALVCSTCAAQLAPRTSEEQRTIDIYRERGSSVVFITTTTATLDPFDLFPQVTQQKGTGSGIIVDGEKGIVVTNFHVVQAEGTNGIADKIEITLDDGRAYPAQFVGVDPDDDLAVLRIVKAPEHLKAISLGDSAQLEVGQRVLAIGNPFGLNKTLTTGIISSLERTIKSPSGHYMRGLIQTDAAINPGNSGGALLDMAGNVIGINTAILSQSGDSAGIGFAVPVNLIKSVLPELIATGKVLRPELGWILVDTNQGPMVYRLYPGGPAEEAGIQPILRKVSGFVSGFVRDFERADLVVKVNGTKVANREEVEEIVREIGAKNKLLLTLRRGGISGRERVVTVQPELR